MKQTLWILAALVLILPSAGATAVTQTLEATQAREGIHVEARLEYRVDSGQTYSGSAFVYVPSTATDVFARHEFNGTKAPSGDVQRTGASDGFDQLLVDLPDAAPRTGTPYFVTVSYEVPGTMLRLRVHEATQALILFATPRSGSVGAITPGSPAQVGSSVHLGAQDVPANTVYTISFTSAPVPVTAQDASKYLWGVAGLLVGVFLIWFAIRQGWIQTPGQRKFVKGGEMESNAMLEARRRTLLAALKELEQAHEAKEVPDAAYAPLKEEYKAQAVRVMRSLEEKKEG